MSLLGDEPDSIFAHLAYGDANQHHDSAHFGATVAASSNSSSSSSGLQSPMPIDASAAAAHFPMVDAHMHPFDGHMGMDPAHMLLKTEHEAVPSSLLDPFGFEAPCSPLLPDPQAHMPHMHIHTGHIMHANAEMDDTLKHMEMHDAVPMAQTDQQSVPLPPPVLPFQPLPVAHLAQVASVAPRGRKAVAAVSVKREPSSPSTIASPVSHFTSPSMPPLHTARVVMPVAAVTVASASSPRMHMGARSSSSAGDSASAGSGGSGSNSAAQSCSSASDSDSDTAFDEPARKKKAGVKQQQGRKRKNKAGSGNSSGAEQGGSVGSTVGDDLLRELESQAAINAGVPGEIPTENKRQQRLQRNRASAQLSRERKKQYMKLLEKQLKELAELNEGLSVQIHELTTENTRLKTKLSSLAMRERVAGRYPNAAAQALRGPSVGSHASTASLQSSPPHHARVGSGDVESLGAHSGPTTPASEVDLPQAKRLKVQAYGAPHSPSSGSPSPSSGGSGSRSSGASFNARAGMLLFTLVMSVGLLYNWAGVDMVQVNQNFDMGAAGVTVATVPMGHAPVVVGGGGGGANGVANHRATLELMSEGAEDPAAHRAHAHLTATVPARGRVLASIASDVDADSHSSEMDAFALVPVGMGHSSSGGSSGSSSAATTSPLHMLDVDDDDSKAIDVYTHMEHSVTMHLDDGRGQGQDLATAARTHLGLDRKASEVELQLLRRLLLSAGGNDSSAASDSANYMFCPSALSITRDAWAGLLHKHNLVLNHSARGTAATPSDLTDDKQLALLDDEDSTTGSKRSRSGKKKHTSAGRLRKVIGLPALPAPGSMDTSGDSLSGVASSLLLSDLGSLPSVSSGLQVGDNLLLWVPLQLASTSLPNGTLADDHADQPAKQGLVEIACRIAHVRPIVMS